MDIGMAHLGGSAPGAGTPLHASSLGDTAAAVARHVETLVGTSTVGGREQATLSGIEELFELLNIIMIAKLLDAPIDKALITRLRDMGLDSLASAADDHNKALAQRNGEKYSSPLEEEDGIDGIDLAAGTAPGQAAAGASISASTSSATGS